MKRKTKWPQDGASLDPFWEEAWDLPSAGIEREEIAPVLEDIFFRALAERAWRMLGDHWQANLDAFAELERLSAQGMVAMARYCSRHLLKRLPAAGITEPVFWDEWLLFMLRMDHASLEEDEIIADYLKSRIGKPGWPAFLRRVVQTLQGKESPEFSNRFLLCVLWDLHPMPLRFWADAAALELLSLSGQHWNLNKIRNTRQELGLSRTAPTIVRSYKQVRLKTTGESALRRAELDDCAAARESLSAMFQAFCRYLHQIGKPGS